MAHHRSRCPCCNSILGGDGWRLGVRLSKSQLRIFDAVQRAGPVGVAGPALDERLSMTYRNRVSTIWQLNETLALVGWRIWAGVAGGNYRLIRWKPPTR